MSERSPEQIQRDIERSRAELAATIDQLAYRTSPKRVSESVKTTLREKARSPQGQAILGGTGAVVVVLVVLRVRKAAANRAARRPKGRPRKRR